MQKNQLILSVKDLNIKFNLRGKVLHAIRGIDLDVYHGEVLAIVGESGSGKSVFTKSFMGLLDANGSISSGTIDYYGADDGKPIRLIRALGAEPGELEHVTFDQAATFALVKLLPDEAREQIVSTGSQWLGMRA